MFKRPYTKFMFYTVLYAILGVICLLLGFITLNSGVLFFGGIFAVLSFMNFRMAKKHKNDTEYITRKIIDKAVDKYKEAKREEDSQKENRKDMEKRYNDFVAELEDDFSDDEYEVDDEE